MFYLQSKLHFTTRVRYGFLSVQLIIAIRVAIRDTIYGDIMRNVREKLAESVGKELDSVEDSLRQIAEERQKKEACMAVLEKLSAKIDKLCNEIEAGGAV